MNYKPPLRNYQQMVRVKKDQDNGSDFSLKQAYGSNTAEDNTAHRLRTLDELALPGGSIRKPGPQDEGGNLSRRSGTAFQHQLNPETQTYFNGTGGPQVTSRNDLLAGTKERAQLGQDAFSKKIPVNPELSPMPAPVGKKKTSAKGDKASK